MKKGEKRKQDLLRAHTGTVLRAMTQAQILSTENRPLIVFGQEFQGASLCYLR